MSATTQQTDSNRKSTVTALERGAARKALALIESQEVMPSPENYAVFYHYALGMNRELMMDIDSALHNDIPFSDNLLNTFYNKYLVATNNQRLINDVSKGAHKMMSNVLRIVSEFSSHTNSYNQDIDGYMDKISVEIEDQQMEDLVRGLIAATANIKERGEVLNMRLEESRMEIESLKKNLDQLTQENQRDFLTGAFNRKALDTMLEDLIETYKGNGGELSVLMLDIDHFKKFNDKFGHLLGDEVLKIVARAVTYCVRGKDTVARYGGEEFCVLLPNTPLEGAQKVAENIRATIATRDLKRKDTGKSFGSLTVSLGGAQMRPDDSLSTLLKRADEALYRSKEEGRNRVSMEQPA